MRWAFKNGLVIEKGLGGLMGECLKEVLWCVKSLKAVVSSVIKVVYRFDGGLQGGLKKALKERFEKDWLRGIW